MLLYNSLDFSSSSCLRGWWPMEFPHLNDTFLKIVSVKAVTKQGYSNFKSMQGGLLLSFAMHNFKHRSFQTRTTRPANSCCFLFYLTTMQVLDWSQRIQPQHKQHSSAPSLGQPSGSEVVFGPSCLRGKSSFSNRGFLLCPLWPLRWAAGKLAGQLWWGMGRTGSHGGTEAGTLLSVTNI